MKTIIGRRLKKLRALYNVTLQDLAVSTGISISTLNRIENGTIKDIKLGIIIKVLKYFKIPFEVLMYGQYYTSKLQISKQIISNLYSLLMKAQETEKNDKENRYEIEMIDLSDKATCEFIKILYACTDRKDIPREKIPYIIGVNERRVAEVFKKYRL
jgi:transcriptional regulator with XRE-family HTH domain